MKLKSIILCFSIFLSLGYSNIPVDRTVYVCGKSDIYHPTTSHSALGRCKSGITKWSESDAKEAGKRICKCKY